MELYILIIGIIFLSTYAIGMGYLIGKKHLRQDYRDNYKKVQIERDNYKFVQEAFAAETIRVLKKAYWILSPISNQWEGRETVEGQEFLSSLRSMAMPDAKESPPPKKDKISKYYEKVMQTNSGSDHQHDYMGTLNPDVRICRTCPSKLRRKQWELNDSFGETWIEDK